MRRLRARWLLALAPVALALLAWGLWLSRDLGVRLAERELAVPSRVYARPLVLVPGARVSERVAATHLRAAGYRSAAKAPPALGEYWLGARRWQIGRRGFRYPDGFEPEGVASVELDRAGFVRAHRGARREAARRALPRPRAARRAARQRAARTAGWSRSRGSRSP